MKKKINKKIIFIILSIVLTVVTISTATYSLFVSESEADNPSSYTTGYLSVTATSKTNNISLTNALPKTDEEGSASDPYIFTIKNIGNLDYKFNIKLLSTGSNTFSPQYIKLKANDDNVTSLSACTNGVIKENIILKAGQSIDINLRVWLSIDTPNTELGKSFNSQIVTDGQAISPSAAQYISSLYNGAPKIIVTDNKIEYNYAASVSMMNDRLGGVTTDYNGGNIRYYGKDPNNYIYFNCDDYANQTSSSCEKWRIIGVFGDKLKIVRDDSIGSYSWDTSAAEINSGYGINEWSKADLMKLLNPGFEDESIDGSLYYNNLDGICYNGEKNVSGSCNFKTNNSGIKNSATRNRIADVKWNLGATTPKSYSDLLYKAERGTDVFQNPEDGIVRTTEWIGKITLMYPSDIFYAIDPNSGALKKDYYLFKNGGHRLLTPANTNAFLTNYVASNGYVEIWPAGTPYEIYPTLFLNANQKISDGDGTLENPYRLLA